MKGRNVVVLILAAVAVGVATAALLRPRRKTHPSHHAPLIGNPESMVVHRLECRLYEPEEFAPSFANLAEAVAVGYRGCGVCRP